MCSVILVLRVASHTMVYMYNRLPQGIKTIKPSDSKTQFFIDYFLTFHNRSEWNLRQCIGDLSLSPCLSTLHPDFLVDLKSALCGAYTN
jgi:hypothetical protein